MSLDMNLVRKTVGEMDIARDILTVWKDGTGKGKARGRQDSSVPRIMRLLGPTGKRYKKEDVIKFLKAMDAAGAGKIVFSKGKLPRFEWQYNRRSLAQAALGTSKRWSVEEQAPPKTALPDVPAGATAAPAAPATQASSDMDPGSMVIRNTRSGFEVTLPLDLTPEQAAAAKTLLAGITT